MKRHESLIPLSREHHDALILAQLIKKNAPAYRDMPKEIPQKRDYSINFFNTKLVPHFNAEEKILFPVVRKKNDEINGIVLQLLKDHSGIAAIVEKLKTNEASEIHLNDLGMLLEKHIRTEERRLFEEIQNVCSAEELADIGKKLKEFLSS